MRNVFAGTVPGYQYGTGLGNYGLGRPAGYQYGTGLGTGLGNYGLGRPAGYQYGTGLGTGLGNYGLGRPAGYQYGTGLGNYGLGTPAGYRQITGPSYYSLGSAGFAAPVGFGQSSYGPVGSQFGWGAAPAGVLGSPFVGGQTAHFGAIGPGGLGAGGRVLSNIYAGSTTGTSGHAFGGCEYMMSRVTSKPVFFLHTRKQRRRSAVRIQRS